MSQDIIHWSCSPARLIALADRVCAASLLTDNARPMEHNRANGREGGKKKYTTLELRLGRKKGGNTEKQVVTVFVECTRSNESGTVHYDMTMENRSSASPRRCS